MQRAASCRILQVRLPARLSTAQRCAESARRVSSTARVIQRRLPRSNVKHLQAAGRHEQAAASCARLMIL
jgi:hypothetical protein